MIRELKVLSLLLHRGSQPTPSRLTYLVWRFFPCCTAKLEPRCLENGTSLKVKYDTLKLWMGLSNLLYKPLLQPYNSSLMEMWPYHVFGWTLTKRAMIGGSRSRLSTVFLSQFPWKTFQDMRKGNVNPDSWIYIKQKGKTTIPTLPPYDDKARSSLRRDCRRVCMLSPTDWRPVSLVWRCPLL